MGADLARAATAGGNVVVIPEGSLETLLLVYRALEIICNRDIESMHVILWTVTASCRSHKFKIGTE